MTSTLPSKPICLPPAPINGGPLETAPPKVGEWIWQPKVDDRRVIIHAPTGTIWNQYGEPSVAMRDIHKFEPAIAQLKLIAHRAEWLDAGLMEYRHSMMRGCVIVFDLMTRRSLDYQQRRDLLASALRILPDDMADAIVQHGGCIRDTVYLINHWCTDAPMELQKWLKEQNRILGRKFYEGLVAKRMKADYPMFERPKTSTPNWIKHRFDQ
jgi:hypothetical protein